MRRTEWQTDTVSGHGYGNPGKPVGLICSMFRPSDDATVFPYLVPANFFAVVSLRQAAEMVEQIQQDKILAGECRALAGRSGSGVAAIRDCSSRHARPGLCL